MITEQADDKKHVDSSFALAISVLRDRIDRLPQEDRNDLCELIPILLKGDDDERDSALLAVREIMDQKASGIRPMEIPDSSSSDLDNWFSYVSRKIKEVREHAGMTQEELAEKADLPQSHISRLENGIHSPTARTLEKIANALGIPPSSFDPSAT